MQSGNNPLKDLTIERATNLAALRCFKCGQEDVDHIIQDELPFTLTTNDPKENREFLFVRALNTDKYTAVPFYEKCHFYAAVKPVPGQNLMMYRIIPKSGNL